MLYTVGMLDILNLYVDVLATGVLSKKIGLMYTHNYPRFLEDHHSQEKPYQVVISQVIYIKTSR